MKKTALITTLLVILITQAFAGANDETSKMLNDLKAALKSASYVQRTSTEAYGKAIFSINGRPVSAFYNTEDGTLIGFSRHLSTSGLPRAAAANIEKRYSGWAVIDAIVFVYADGHSGYFAEVAKGKNHIALRITAKGQVSVYGKMPS